MNMITLAEVAGSVAGSLLGLSALLRLFFGELKLHLKEEFATKEDFIELRNDVKEALQSRRQSNRSQVAARKVLRAIQHAGHAERKEDGE